jgi:hypothetical protein
MDDYHRSMQHKISIGGYRCPCCGIWGHKPKYRTRAKHILSRYARRRLKQRDQRDH